MALPGQYPAECQHLCLERVQRVLRLCECSDGGGASTFREGCSLSRSGDMQCCRSALSGHHQTVSPASTGIENAISGRLGRHTARQLEASVSRHFSRTEFTGVSRSVRARFGSSVVLESGHLCTKDRCEKSLHIRYRRGLKYGATRSEGRPSFIALVRSAPGSYEHGPWGDGLGRLLRTFIPVARPRRQPAYRALRRLAATGAARRLA